MNNREIFLTKEGLKKLKEEIKILEGIKRKEIKEDIKRATEYGDISENAEYNIALENQRMNEIKIVRLKQKLSKVRVVEEKSSSDGIDIGTTLKLKDLDSGKLIEYVFVPDDQIDFSKNKISISCPLGQAFSGHCEGEKIEIELPIGIVKYKILKILK
ncbi:MAG: transcription elongation factor GreA [Candidatus Caldatribacteriota bacterium]|nr:transcription elongation factor GreA [Candidatus Caldatribacteriota bacterium]